MLYYLLWSTCIIYKVIEKKFFVLRSPQKCFLLFLVSTKRGTKIRHVQVLLNSFRNFTSTVMIQVTDTQTPVTSVSPSGNKSSFWMLWIPFQSWSSIGLNIQKLDHWIIRWLSITWIQDLSGVQIITVHNYHSTFVLATKIAKRNKFFYYPLLVKREEQ